jgi:hypothetical protein
MSNGDKSSLKDSALNRRNILLGGTTLAVPTRSFTEASG